MGTRDNGDVRAVFGNHARGGSRPRDGYDRGSAKVVSRGAGRMGDRVGNVGKPFLRAGGKPFTVIDIPLGALRDGSHCPDSLDRIVPRGGFPRKHDRAGAVIDRVGNVGSLRPRRPGTMDHALEHLGCGNHHFTDVVAFFYQDFLQYRHVLERDLHTHIAARDHNTVGNAQDVVNIGHSLRILNLGYDADDMVSLPFQQLPDIQNILRTAYKRRGDEIKACFGCKYDVGTVLLTDIRHGQAHAGNIYPLAVR